MSALPDFVLRKPYKEQIISMPMPPVALALERIHIPHRLFTHPGAVHSLEQAAQERGQRPEQVVRSILFRLGKDGHDQERYALALIAGSEQVSWKALRQHFARSRLTMARPEEVQAVTGYEIGAVSPFGLPEPLPVLLDRAILAQDEVSIGSGVRGTTVILQVTDLVKGLGDAVIVGDFRASAERQIG
jgi:Cys-tRNA(Pro) deacylase